LSGEFSLISLMAITYPPPRPGFRERLIFCQHQYCDNSFWELLQTNLKILWSDSFQDTFYHNAHTGKYHISPLFEQRIRDINAWTMSTDFFTHFPELSEDIPAYMGTPTSLPSPPYQNQL
jgi:hypothetical protein